jgi:hypothetical protein
VDRHRHQVVREVEIEFLVEVVADARSVREELLGGHAGVDQRKVLAEDQAHRRREVEAPFRDQRNDRERREPLRAARDRELRIDTVRHLVRPIRETVRLLEHDAVRIVDANDAGEPRLGRDRVEPRGQAVSPPSIVITAPVM